jgi:hypothetical protein
MTPVAKEGEKATFQQGSAQKAKTGQVWLTNQVRDIHDWNLLPTTTAMDYKASGGAEGSSNVTLTDAIVRGRGLLPTPRTSDTNGPGRHGTGGPDLRTVASELLPTPRAQHGEGRNQTIWERDSKQPQNLENALAHVIGDSRANSTETGPREILQNVRQAIHPAPIRESTGGPNSLPGSRTLLAELRKQEASHPSGQQSLPGAEDQAPCGVREVRGEVEASCSSQGSQSDEQLSGETWKFSARAVT